MPGIEFTSGDSGRRIVMDLSAKIARAKDLSPIMPELAGVVYESTRQWFDSKGEGSWPQLSPSTIEKKASQGMADPERPLYALGNLYESVTSPSGPHSYFIPMFDGMVIGVSWTAAKALAMGTNRSGAGHKTKIPARPIWPPLTSALGLEIKQKCGRMILAYITGRPTPGSGGNAPPSGRAPAGGYGTYKGGQFMPLGYRA